MMKTHIAAIRGAALALALLPPALGPAVAQEKSMDMEMMSGADLSQIPRVPPVAGYAEGERIHFIHTEVSDPEIAGILTEMMGSPVPVVPSLAEASDEMLASVYVFTNGGLQAGPLRIHHRRPRRRLRAGQLVERAFRQRGLGRAIVPDGAAARADRAVPGLLHLRRVARQHPLAAIPWSKDASFGGGMSFLGADLGAATVIYLNAKYYGWAFTACLSGLLYVAMVMVGVSVHWIFAALGAIPTVRSESLQEMMSFGVDTHTFWLNMAFIPVGLGLLWLRWHHMKQDRQQEATASGE